MHGLGEIVQSLAWSSSWTTAMRDQTMSDNVTAFSAAREMKEAEFERERAEIRATYGDNAREAGGLADQALARLFYRSQWTQERLAAKEGCTLRHAARRLLFGAFLDFGPVGPIPKNLTERRFRKFWERTDTKQKDEQRFRHVVEELQNAEPHAPRRHGLTKRITDEFGDSKWHNVETIAAYVGEPLESMSGILGNLKQQKSVGLCESRKHGKHIQYRLAAAGRSIDYDVLIQEIRPHLDELEAESKKGLAHANPMRIAQLVVQVKRIIEALAEKTSQRR